MTDQSRREDFRRSLTVELAVTVIVNVIFASSVSTALTRWLSRTYTGLRPYIWPLGVALAAAIFIAALAFVRARDRFRPNYPRLSFDFAMVSKTIDYRYISRDTLRYTKRMKLRALRGGLERYVDKYNWSGGGSVEIQSMNPEHTVRELGRRNVWRLYEIAFARPLAKNDVIEVAVKWDLKVLGRPPAPFFSQTVNEPTDKLVFRLRLPEEFDVRQVVKSVLPSIESLRPLESNDGLFEGEDFVWEIHRPKLLYCYQVSWYDPDYEIQEGPNVIREQA